MSSTPLGPTPPAVETFVAAAREYVRRVVGVELDGTPTSLAFLDHYIRHTRKEGELSDEVLALVAGALGAYLGVVAIERFGGEWVLEEADDPTTWRVELAPVELRFWPVGMAAEALRQGDVEGYDGSFATKQSLMAPLAEALSAVSPVEEEYYYSLTGRLETLEHAVDLLLALTEREKDRARNGDRN